MDALPEHPALRYVLGLQEGVVLSMADGFARATRRLAACNVHVAPGLGKRDGRPLQREVVRLAGPGHGGAAGAGATASPSRSSTDRSSRWRRRFASGRSR